MDRKKFIKTCGFACLGALPLSTIIQSCSSANMLSAPIQGADMLVPLSAFEKKVKGEIQYLKYLVLQNDALQYPICVYRHDENQYMALLMRCTHQGTELRAFGTKLVCPAHGSEFTISGSVQNGPADQSLRSFPVTLEAHQLKISLT